MTNTYTLLFTSDNLMNPATQLFCLDEFFNNMETDLESMFSQVEITPKTNINNLVKAAMDYKD